MKDYKKNPLIVLVIVFALSYISQASGTEYREVDPNEIPGKLAELASVTKANYEKIKTWKGKITVHYVWVSRGGVAAEDLKEFAGVEPAEEPNELHDIADYTIEFKIDLEKDRFFSYSDRPEAMIYWNPENDTTYKSLSGPSQDIEIVTQEYQICISPFRMTKDHVVLERIARKERPIPTARSDPRKVFKIGKPIWLAFSQLSQSLQMTGIETFGVVLKEKTEGGNVTYRLEVSDPGKKQPFHILVLSGEAGFNPTYIESREDGLVLTRKTLEFTEIEGIYLPSKWNVSQYYPSDGGLMREVVRTIDNMQINVPIPDSTFSERSYLREGEKLIDHTNNKKEFIFEDGKLVEFEQQ